MMAASRSDGFSGILTVPHQPSSYFTFSIHPFGKQNRSFHKEGKPGEHFMGAGEGSVTKQNRRRNLKFKFKFP